MKEKTFILIRNHYNSLLDLLRNINLWIVPLAISSGMATVMLYISATDFTLNRFDNRLIGDAIIHAVDPTMRKDVYYNSMLIFILTFIAIIYIAGILEKKIDIKNLSQSFTLEKELIFELGLVLVITATIGFYYILIDANISESIFLRSMVILFFFVFLIFTHIILKLFALLRFPKQSDLQILNRPEYIFFTLLLPLPVLYFGEVVFLGGIKLGIVHFLSAYLIMYFFFHFILRKIPLDSFMYAAIPVFLVPFSPIAANEIQYSLSKFHSFDPRLICILIFVVLIAVGTGIYLYSCKKEIRNHTNIIDNVLYPIILLTMLAYTQYKEVWIDGIYDLLHLGNRITPVQQLFEFGKIPLLNYWGAQHISIGSILYGLINGFNGLEPLLWDSFFTSAIVMMIAYFAFKPICSGRWLFLSFMFFPMIPIVGLYYGGALLPLLYLPILIKNKRFKDYVVFLILALLPFIWMPSMGKISVLSSLIMMLFISNSRKDILNIIKAGVLVFGVPTLIYALLTILQGASILDKIVLIKTFSSIEFDGRSYSTILSEDYSVLWQAVLQYGLFPLTALMTIIYVFVKKSKTLLEYIVFYVAVASLVSGLRGLARHSLIEGFSFFFYIVLLLLIPFLLNQAKAKKKLFFSVIMAIVVLFVLESKTLMTSDPLLISGVKRYDFKKFEVGESRYFQNKEALPNNLIAFFDEYLEEDQTFFEFINGHLLYTLTHREAPFFHCAELVLDPEPVQDIYVKQFNIRYEQGDIPIVVFDNFECPKDLKVLNNVDGIPGAMECYKIAEFIYQHYTPWITVDGFHLWLANNSDLANKLNISPGISLKADNTGSYDVIEKQSENGNVVYECGSIDPQINFTPVPVFRDNYKRRAYISIRAKSSVASSVQVYFNYNSAGYSQSNSTFIDISSDNEIKSYNVELPGYMGETLSSFRIDPPDGALFEIESVEVVEKDAFDINEMVTQSFNMIKLPYIWANYDKKFLETPPMVLKDLGTNLEINDWRVVNFESDIDKSTGNYVYLEVTSDLASEQFAKISYGKENQNGFLFTILPGTNNYVIRISSQYAWMSEAIDSFKVETSSPIIVNQISVLKGD